MGLLDGLFRGNELKKLSECKTVEEVREVLILWHESYDNKMKVNYSNELLCSFIGAQNLIEEFCELKLK